ncbi:MAG TPA: cytochrome D1 domain-containing protein [Thermoanaerobaculia bacterium]|nr:cytochrome D1 domain-containing protein [Thermoanaerobaculia bacterium]
MSRFTAFSLALLAAAGLAGARGLAAASARSSSLAVTPDGGMLAVTNPDSDSLTLLDAASLEVLAEVPVGRSPRAVAIDPGGTRAYVSGRLDDSLTMVDLWRWRAIASRTVGHQPGGVVAGADARVYAAATGAGKVMVFDGHTLALLATVDTEPAPDGLALAADGRTLYVTHAPSGRLSVVDTATAAVRRVIPLPEDADLAGAAALDEATRRAYIPATHARNVSPLRFDTTLVPFAAVVDLVAERELPRRRVAISIADRAVSRPADALVIGGRLWVVHAGSGDLSVIDLRAGRAVAHLLVGENPTGMAVAPDGATVYIHDALGDRVTVIDVAALAVRAAVSVTHSPLPAAVRRGKLLFNTSRPAAIARDRWISCAGCHPDGKSDGRTWPFPDGPRNTPSLLGVRDTLPIHWSGDLDELQDVELTVRTLQAGTGLAAGPSNCEPACDRAPPNAGRSRDLDDLAAFMASLRPSPSPHLIGGVLGAGAERGRALFAAADTGCSRCHTAPPYTDRQRHDVGTGGGPGERKGPAFDTPSLRDLVATAPYLHDGRAATLEEVLTTRNAGDRHGHTSQLGPGDVADLAAFLRSLPFEAEPDECVPDGKTLCLLAGHLRAAVVYTDPRDGTRRAARAVRLGDGAGGFAFFDSEALDVTVKAVDGRPLTPALWVFAGSLTSVPWELTVNVPGEATARTYRSSTPGCGVVDVDTFVAPAGTTAFPAGISATALPGLSAASGPATVARSTPPHVAPEIAGCRPSPTTLCLLGDRFRIEATWRNPHDASSGGARAVPLRERSGFFSFFDRGNPEVAVKLVDGRDVNGSFWLFHGPLTDLGYELVVTDTATGARRVYTHAGGGLCGAADVQAFAGAAAGPR